MPIQSYVLVITCSGGRFGVVKGQFEPECIFKNFKIALEKRGQSQNLQKLRG